MKRGDSRVSVRATPCGDGGLDLCAVGAGKDRLHCLDRLLCPFNDLSRSAPRFDVQLFKLIIRPISLLVNSIQKRDDFRKIRVRAIRETMQNFSMCAGITPNRKTKRSKVIGGKIEGGVIGSPDCRTKLRLGGAHREFCGKLLEIARVHGLANVPKNGDSEVPFRCRSASPSVDEKFIGAHRFLNALSRKPNIQNHVSLVFNLGILLQRQFPSFDRSERLFRDLDGQFQVCEQLMGRTKVVNVVGNCYRKGCGWRHGLAPFPLATDGIVAFKSGARKIRARWTPRTRRIICQRASRFSGRYSMRQS